MGIDALITEANELFKRSQNYQRQGNWTAYGEAIDKLEGVLKKLADKNK